MLDWLFNPPTAQTVNRTLASKLLLALCCHLPDGFRVYTLHLDGGQSLESVLSDVGQALGQLLGQQKIRIQQLEQECQTVRTDLWWVTQQRDALISDPLRQQMSEAQAEIKTLSARAEQAEAALERAQRALAAEQSTRRQEVEEQRAYITSQNRIIAQQQLRLNTLLGDTSGAETTGGKTS